MSTSSDSSLPSEDSFGLRSLAKAIEVSGRGMANFKAGIGTGSTVPSMILPDELAIGMAQKAKYETKDTGKEGGGGVRKQLEFKWILHLKIAN